MDRRWGGALKRSEQMTIVLRDKFNKSNKRNIGVPERRDRKKTSSKKQHSLPLTTVILML